MNGSTHQKARGEFPLTSSTTQFPKSTSKDKYKEHYEKLHKKVPFPDVTEFGKVFEIETSALSDESLIQATYQTVIADYLNNRRDNFPTYHELPEIKMHPKLISSRSISWYIAVPNEFVLTSADKIEDELWKS